MHMHINQKKVLFPNLPSSSDNGKKTFAKTEVHYRFMWNWLQAELILLPETIANCSYMMAECKQARSFNNRMLFEIKEKDRFNFDILIAVCF